MVFTDEERIDRICDREACTQLINRHSIYYSNDWRRRELDELWVSQPLHAAKASYGSNYGYYYGKSEVQRWYVDEFMAKRKAQLKTYCEKQGIPEDEKLLGAGSMYMCPMSTSIVRIAKDGQSAKGIWYSIGQQSDLKEDGTASGLWMYLKICADFVKEDGKFKLYHIVVANDQNYQAGTQYNALEQ